MSETVTYEAGVFVLMAEGWAIVKRRSFADESKAMAWMRRNAGSQVWKHPPRRVRGSMVEASGWMTLDMVLAEYEKKRLAGDGS